MTIFIVYMGLIPYYVLFSPKEYLIVSMNSWTQEKEKITINNSLAPN